MEDDAITLRQDIQSCVAKNIKILDGNYSFFFWDKSNMFYSRSLALFENLKIYPDKNNLHLKGQIIEKLFNLTEEQMTSIRQQVWLNEMQETLRQIAEKKKTAKQKNNEKAIAEMNLQKFVDNMQNNNIQYRQATEFDRKLMCLIQDKLKELNIQLDYTENKEDLVLAKNFDNLSLTKCQLQEMQQLAEKVDMFLIAPIYDEDEKTCIGVRLAIAISLRADMYE